MQTKIEAINIDLLTPFIVVKDLVDVVLPSGVPATLVLISDTNNYDKILSSRELRDYIVSDKVVLVVNDFQLGKEESLQFLDKSKNVSKWRTVSITDADSPYEAEPGDFIIAECVAGNIVINFPAANAEEVRSNDIMVMRADENQTLYDLTVLPDGVETINYLTTGYKILGRGDIAVFTSTATEWFARLTKKSVWVPINVDFSMSPFTAKPGMHLEVDTTGGAVVILFPPAADWKGDLIQCKKIDVSANNVEPTADGAELIDGSATAPFNTQYQSITFMSNGVGVSKV